MFSLVFTRRYSMAHRLMADARSKCAVPHGHNELVTVKLQAVAARRLDGVANMVEPFEIAKGCWNRWIDEEVDHALQLSDRDPLIGYFQAHEPDRLARLLVTPGDPADVLPRRSVAGNRADWWWRADGSINDLDRDAARP